ncbi:hypothetical protein NPIL_236271 [Nephila pilipes]|uniref:Uncharacterized protein n=1 Tax=Nephila pilipes TaxID=299642 RepID=A0A8X6QY84_NEPPI|nr:hypothetical protein NPIL_236271 [Nephila pilipes]
MIRKNRHNGIRDLTSFAESPIIVIAISVAPFAKNTVDKGVSRCADRTLSSTLCRPIRSIATFCPLIVQPLQPTSSVSSTIPSQMSSNPMN